VFKVGDRVVVRVVVDLDRRLSEEYVCTVIRPLSRSPVVAWGNYMIVKSITQRKINGVRHFVLCPGDQVRAFTLIEMAAEAGKDAE